MSRVAHGVDINKEKGKKKKRKREKGKGKRKRKKVQRKEGELGGEREAECKLPSRVLTAKYHQSGNCSP